MAEDWEPWRYWGLPEIGDYVQIEAVMKGTPMRHVFEGIVIEIDLSRKIIRLNTENENDHWSAERWRKRILRDFNPPKVRARELEEV